MGIKLALELSYLDYFNNYLTVEKYAADNKLTINQAELLLSIGKEIENKNYEFVPTIETPLSMGNMYIR